MCMVMASSARLMESMECSTMLNSLPQTEYSSDSSVRMRKLRWVVILSADGKYNRIGLITDFRISECINPPKVATLRSVIQSTDSVIKKE